MKPIAEIIAENLVALRKKHNLTQNDLAEKLKYSDNTVSRWEHAEITPSIETLEKISEFYGVSLESLLKENITQTIDKDVKTLKISRVCSALLVVMVVWLLAIIAFVYGQTIIQANLWTVFIWAVPVSCLVFIPFYPNTGRRVFKFIIFTIFVWTFLLAVFLEFYRFRLWLIFFTGIPVQLALVIWAFIKPKIKIDHKK